MTSDCEKLVAVAQAPVAVFLQGMFINSGVGSNI